VIVRLLQSFLQPGMWLHMWKYGCSTTCVSIGVSISVSVHICVCLRVCACLLVCVCMCHGCMCAHVCLCECLYVCACVMCACVWGCWKDSSQPACDISMTSIWHYKSFDQRVAPSFLNPFSSRHDEIWQNGTIDGGNWGLLQLCLWTALSPMVCVCVRVCVRAPVFPFTTHHSFTTVPRSGPSSMKSCDVYGTRAIYISDRAYQDYPADTVKTTVLCLSEKVKTWPCRSVCAVRTCCLRREPADEQLCTEACIIWVYGRGSCWTTVYGSRRGFQLGQVYQIISTPTIWKDAIFVSLEINKTIHLVLIMRTHYLNGVHFRTSLHPVTYKVALASS
jgi:hypothetical protein